MSDTRYEGDGFQIDTFVGPSVVDGTRRRWQITNTVTGTYVTLADGQWRDLCLELAVAVEDQDRNLFPEDAAKR